MPSFIEKIGKLFKKQETYRPSQSKAAAKPAADSKKPAAKQLPQAEAPRKHARGGERPKPASVPQKKRPAPEKAPSPAPVRKGSQPWNPDSFQVEPQEGKTRFRDLELPVDLLHAIADLNFRYCTPIQAEILPSVLAGKDMAGKAQTGTG